MAIEYLKRGTSISSLREEDAKVRATVEAILADIEARGDAAVRDYRQVRQYDRAELPPGEREIAALVAEVAEADLDDIRFAQAQVRRFAEVQRAALRTSRSRPCPASSSATEYPCAFRRLLRARRQISDGRLGAHVCRHRQGRRGAAHRRLRPPPFQGGPHPAMIAAMHLGGARRDLFPRRRAGGGAMALGTETIRRSTCWSAPATPSSPRPSGSSTAGSASIFSPGRPRRW